MDHLIPWFTLKSVPRIGNLRFRRLVERFGSPQAVLNAPVSALEQVEGITSRMATAIARQPIPDGVQKELERITRGNIRLLTLHHDNYPKLLLEIPDPPPLLYIYGDLDLANGALAVVGSRKASSYGLTTTRRLCKRMAALGIVVVSGMARGIDTAAHQGALEAGGRTVAVLGCGLATIYPAQNRDLFHRIAASGAVVSEFSLDTPPDAPHFPMRNRIISGLSLGTVVVEAAQRSGSLITARLAAEQGREVFAVPGSIHAATSKGAHHLIQQGAKLVTKVEDIIEEIGPQDLNTGTSGVPGQGERTGGKTAPPDLTQHETKVFNALGAYGVHIDSLAHQLDFDVATVSSILMQLELKGFARQEPGNHYLRHMDHMDAIE
jgi:DNA processing protein